MTFSITGIREAGLCVSELESWLELFTRHGGWQIQHQGFTDDALRQLWPAHGSQPVQEVLLQRPGEAFGKVRLFKFAGIEQQPIRAQAMPWDTGGIFDLDLRVDQLSQWHQLLSERHWGGISPPVDWQFGNLKIREWLALGPESVVIAFIQRLAPPLEGPPLGHGFGHMFNSSQTVSHMRDAVAFYEYLGFKTMVSHYGPLEGGGGAVLGLEPEILDKEPVELVIMHPQGIMEGSVELVALPHRPGQRVDERALPHNLGLNLLRFEVEGIKSLAARLSLLPKTIVRGPVPTHLEPVGAVDLLATRTPDGAWLEFYQRRGSG